MNLVIVESPAKAKTINKYLGKDYIVLASYGHVRDLPSKNGSVDPENNFKMEWELDTFSKKYVKEITDAAADSDRIILATDPDLEACKIENQVEIGPYSRIRPDTILKEGSKIGNFVEIKKSTIGKKSKVSHLSYIGDTEIGKAVNVGAGTITCNYDGIKKSKTKIKDKVFIGSNSSLVAPVTIENESIVGAGSVITKNVSKKSLALTRSLQTEIKNYKRKK